MRRSTVAEKKNISASSIVSEQTLFFILNGRVIFYKAVNYNVWRCRCCLLSKCVCTSMGGDWIYCDMKESKKLYVWNDEDGEGVKNKVCTKVQLILFSIYRSFSQFEKILLHKHPPSVCQWNKHTNSVRNTNELACNVMYYICP